MCSGKFMVMSGLLAVAMAGCGGSGGGLPESDIRAALERLPYHYHYRPVSHSGSGSVVAGIARFGRHATYFAVIGGHPKITGRAVPHQRLPNGRFQPFVDSTYGSSGAPWETQFVYTHTSIPRISEDIDTAICEAAGGEGCNGL